MLSNLSSKDGFQYRLFNLRLLGFLFLCDLVFLLAPVFSLSIQILFILHSKTCKRIYFKNFLLLLAIFLGLINTTKEFENDIIRYIDWYNLAADRGFWEFVLMNGREYLYNVIVYIVAKISGNNQNIFLIFVTFLGYYLVLSSIFRIICSINAPAYVWLFVILIVAFFPPLFNISTHLIRQFLAGALINAFLSIKIVKNRNCWLLLVASLLIHSSAIFFFPFLLVPFFARSPKGKVLIYIIIYIFVLSMIAPSIGSLAKSTDFPMISYIGQRMSQSSYFQLGNLNIQIFLFIFIGLCLIIYKTYFNKGFPRGINEEGYYICSNLFTVLSVFIIITNFNKNTVELAGRFSFYLYFLMPIIAVVASFKKLPSKILLFSFSIFMLIYFVYNLIFGVWKFNNPLDLLITPIFSYF